MRQPLSILIDTREQRPWAWEPHEAVSSVRGLRAGDYALEVDTDAVSGGLSPVRFAIERKSLDDFLGTISTGWNRFNREVDRMADFPAKVMIVEANFSDCCFKALPSGRISQAHNHTRLSPSFISRRIAELTLMGVSVLFAENAGYAAGLAYRIFVRRFNQVCPDA